MGINILEKGFFLRNLEGVSSKKRNGNLGKGFLRKPLPWEGKKFKNSIPMWEGPKGFFFPPGRW